MSRIPRDYSFRKPVFIRPAEPKVWQVAAAVFCSILGCMVLMGVAALL